MRRAVASLCVAAVIAALIVTDLFFFPFELLRARAGAPEIPLRAEGEMRVHIVDVGQGDCAIVEFPDGSSMMIDGGDGTPAHTRAVIGYCMALGIERFGSVLLTHPDSDHAGGLDAVLSAFGAERIYLPMRFPAESGEEEYAGFFAAAEDSGAELIRTRALIPVLPEEDGPFYYGMFLSRRATTKIPPCSISNMRAGAFSLRATRPSPSKRASRAPIRKRKGRYSPAPCRRDTALSPFLPPLRT